MNPSLPNRPPARHLPSWAFAWLLLALLAAPWLGSVHAVMHAKAPAAVVAAAATGAGPDHAVAVRHGGLRSLFGEHSHNGDCRLYDQLSHGDGLHLAQALPPVVLPAVAVLAWHAGECLRRWATLFDARGPPLLA